jgi:nucleoside phosphorylase
MMNDDNDPRHNPEEYMVNHITAYRELTVLSYTPSFLFPKEAFTDIKMRYANELIKRIRNAGIETANPHEPKKTTIYLAESGLKEISRLPMKDKEDLLNGWDIVVSYVEKAKDRLNVYVVPDEDLPTVSFILGRVSGIWGNRSPWDLLVEYRVGVDKESLFSIATSEHLAKWFLNMPLQDLPNEITWILQKLKDEVTITGFADWIVKKDIRSTLPPPKVAILSAMPNEIVYYQNKFGSIYSKYQSGIDRGRFELNNNAQLELIFPNTGYGRYFTHQSVTGLALKYPSIDSFYFIGVAGGSEVKNVNLLDVVVSSEIIELVYEKMILGTSPERPKMGRKILPLNDSLSFIFGVSNHSIDDSLKRHAQRLKDLSVSDPGKWEELLREYTKGLPSSEYKDEIFSGKKLPAIHFEAIFSSDHNVNHKEFRDLISTEYNVYAFEMEGGGLAGSCKSFGKKFLDIRGISDPGNDPNNERIVKDPILQPLASAVASAALDWLLQIRLKTESSEIR